jgi:hypothetical protein
MQGQFAVATFAFSKTFAQRVAMASSSSWMSSATNATASLISIAAHELLIDPLQELGGAMEDALDLVVGEQEDGEQEDGEQAARPPLGDVSNAARSPAAAATKAAEATGTPHKPRVAGAGAARTVGVKPESMTFAELMALIETELNLDATLKPKEVLSIAQELLGLEPVPASAAGGSLKYEAIRVAQMLLPAPLAGVASPATPGIVRRQPTVAAIKEAAAAPASPCCTPPAVTEARGRRRTAFLLQEVGGRDRLHSAEKFLAGRSTVEEETTPEQNRDGDDDAAAASPTRAEPQDEPAEDATGQATAAETVCQPEPEPEPQPLPDLSLMEELLLLGIRSATPSGDGGAGSPSVNADSDIFWNGNLSTALRGAILAELVLRQNVVIKQQGVVQEPTVLVRSASLTGDMVLDETVHIIEADQSGTWPS